jgi:cholesterol transport system auxiliary component
MTGLMKPLAILLAFALPGCASLTSLNSAATPTDLYLLTPKSTFDPSLPRLRQQIVVAEPTATAAVSTDRIAVQPSALEVEYLPRARWVDRAPLIIQSLLIESYENSGRVDAVGRSAIGLSADYIIVTDVREFQAKVPDNAPDGAALQAHVRLNIKIVYADVDRIIASSSFEKLVTTASDDTIDVVDAFDQALGSTMRNAVEWSIRKMHADAQNRPQRSDGF